MCCVLAYAGPPLDKEGCQTLARLMQEGLARGRHSTGWAWSEGASRRKRACFVGGDAIFFTPHLIGRRHVIGHCRYSTSGDWRTPENNQPLLVGGVALAFNGVISMGTKPEFEAQFGVRCDSDNDGEVFLRRLLAGQTPADFLAENPVSFAGAWLDGERVLYIRNAERPLWMARGGGEGNFLVSTEDIALRAGLTDPSPVSPLLPGEL